MPETPVIHCRVELMTAEDRSTRITNGFTFGWGGGSPPVTSDFDSLATLLEAFYNTPGTGGTHYMGFYYSRSVSAAANASEITMTDVTAHLDGSAAGSPFAIYPFTFTGPGSGIVDLPAQVAAVMSSRADYDTDSEFGTHTRPRASDRNRCYLGPLNNGAIELDSSTPPKVIFTPGFLADMFHSAKTLWTATSGTPFSWSWLIWSKEHAAVKLNEFFSADLVPDTQRRRADARGNLIWTDYRV
jgi:hypothetical protein